MKSFPQTRDYVALVRKFSEFVDILSKSLFNPQHLDVTLARRLYVQKDQQVVLIIK